MADEIAEVVEYKTVAKLKALQNSEIEKMIYTSVMENAKKDKSFERLVKAMTIDRVFGGSSLKKNGINF